MKTITKEGGGGNEEKKKKKKTDNGAKPFRTWKDGDGGHEGVLSIVRLHDSHVAAELVDQAGIVAQACGQHVLQCARATVGEHNGSGFQVVTAGGTYCDHFTGRRLSRESVKKREHQWTPPK